MGEIVDSGAGIDPKPSLCRVAMEKAQAELRVEYDVREERRRELEFLEKGGDPLDFKLDHATSVSVQSTSHTDQLPHQNLTGEAKGGFTLTASPHGDSVESSGRLGVAIACEPNSADNFDSEKEIPQNDRKSIHPSRSSIPPLEHSSHFDNCRNIKDSEDSPISHLKKGRAYKRRKQSRTNRDGPCSIAADMASGRGSASSVTSHHGTDGNVMHSSTSIGPDFSEAKLNLSNLKEKLEEAQNLSLQVDEAPITIRIDEPLVIVGRDNKDTLGAEKTEDKATIRIVESLVVVGRDNIDTLGADETEDNAAFAHLNATSNFNEDDKCTPTDDLINNALFMTKGLDFESACTQTNVSVDGNKNIDSELCTILMNVDSNEGVKDHTLPVRGNTFTKMAIEDHVTYVIESALFIKEDQSSMSHQVNGFTEDHPEVDRGNSYLKDEAKHLSNVEGREKPDGTELISEKELVPQTESPSHVRPPFVDPVSCELNKDECVGPSPVLDSQPCIENQPKSLDKAHEDRILDEARVIAAKRKRIAEVSIGLLPREQRHKCHWDLVLDEMAWLANDFVQERLWKTTAASQICRHAAFASRTRLDEQSKLSKEKSVAHTLAKAVMEFWHSVGISIENSDSYKLEMDKVSQDGLQSTRRKEDHAVYGFAVRFLQFNCSLKALVKIEVSEVTDVACDIELPEVSWQDQFTEESLFCAIPPGAMEMYRNLIVSYLEDCKRIGSNVENGVVTSLHDAGPECGYKDKDYGEDKGESLYYHPPALCIDKPSKKKRKNMNTHSVGSYEFEGDVGYGHCAETRNGTTRLNVIEKRPANNLHVDITTKRLRTARVAYPYDTGPTVVTPVLSRAGTSSEDTNSFQDDQSFIHDGSVIPGGSEVESTMNFKQSVFGSVDILAKPKRKKKINHKGLSYDHRWQSDSFMQNEQKVLVRKRLYNYQLESNGNSDLLGQHAKKPKVAKYALDYSFDNIVAKSGSVASPVASEMSNLSIQNKMIKFIGGRNRGKKGKGLKVIGQLGSGSPWTIVEEQALVVLVHDMGPNWELVSDAINSILHFKCIFRKPQECKERHKFLMDSPSGDGADSGEDSGSSQHYPSTLPGIPKGSARQLFQTLHAHVEEDNIKSRFEKIIRIEQQLFTRKKKNDNQYLKHRAPAHGSHFLSLSQVIPNNLNGGVLTPLDLCDAVAFNQDSLSIEYQSPHPGGLPLTNQSGIPFMHPPSGLHLQLQALPGSPDMGIRHDLTSPPSQSTGTRDVRYSVPRSGSLPIEERQRLHQYNSMLPERNVQASNSSSSGSLSGSDRGVCMHPGANGVSIMSGTNQSIPMTRSGVPSSPIMASNVGGMPSNMNMHPGTASSHGSGFRHHNSLHCVQSAQSSEDQRQLILQDQMQATHTNSPGLSNNQTNSPLPTFPGNHHPHVLNSPHPRLPKSNHSPTPDQQACNRISREKKTQHMQRQHHPVSSSALVTGQTPSPITRVSQQQKNVKRLGRRAQCGPGRMTNLEAKQQQALPGQQLGRQHPYQLQQPPNQKAPNLSKGNGRGSMVVHQNLPINSSQVNGLNSARATQVAENRDSDLNLVQGPNLHSGSTLNTLPPSTDQGSSTVVLSSNHQHLKSQPSLKVVNQSQPGLQRISQQNRQVNSSSLTKSKVDCLTEQKSSSVAVQPACINSASNVVKKVANYIRESSVTNESSSLGPSTSQAVTNSLSYEPLSSGNSLDFHGLEAQWQQKESQLQPSPLQPLLPQKQSQIQGGQSVAFTGTINSRPD